MAVKTEQKSLSPKGLLSLRRELVMTIPLGQNRLLHDIDIKAASNIIAWVKALLPTRKFTSATDDGGVRVWRLK